MKLKFLGTGGGRHTTAKQRRRTAGMVVLTEETQVHIDPGPGALVYSRKEIDNPEETEALIVTHGHMDHSSDAGPIIELITEVSGNPGAVFGSKSVLEGYGEVEKTVFNYHQNLCKRTEVLEENGEYSFKDLEIKSQQMFHTDPKTVGLRLETEDSSIGFWTDSRYSEELLSFYEGCDTMVLNTVTSKDTNTSKHINVKDAVKIAENIDPSTTILTHFGLGLLENLEQNKEWVEENTDQKIIWAEDGMEFPGNRKLKNF